MASIDIGAGSGGKKSVDASIPLIPFIDLLLCCVMFLLVTAVWNELASIDAQQNTPGQVAADLLPSTDIELQVLVSADGYLVSSNAGESVRIPRIGDKLDVAGLSDRLEIFRRAYPQEKSITVAPDDGIPFEAVIATLDAVRSRGFSAITL